MIKRDLDSPTHPNPLFARHVVEHGLLKAPLRLIDAGALGGLHHRWNVFRPRHLRAFMFDPQMQAETLEDATVFPYALGDRNGTVDLQILADPFGSSVRNDVVDPALDYTPEMRRVVETRQVEMRTLDSLWGTTLPTELDVLKIDCEGCEYEILKGSNYLLSMAGMFLLEVETHFNGRETNLVWPNSFNGPGANVLSLLSAHDFRLLSVANNALPYRSFMDRARALGIEPYCEPAPTVFNAVFYRDRGDDPLKRAAVLELYGIVDLAYDICIKYGVSQDLADLLIQPC